jgi:glycosyltransferase involved in cell wall biosynthesis
VVYYYGIFDQGFTTVAKLPASRKVFYYHNQTPPEFFDDHDKGTAQALRKGLRQIQHADRYFSRFLANSPYTIAQQRSRGVLHDIDWRWLPPWVSTSPRFALGKSLQKRRYIGCFVGRIVPHKAVEKSIRVFRGYQKWDPNARMAIVGSGEGKYYSEVLKLIRSTKNIDHFPNVTDGKRQKILSESQCLFNFSMHEGFALPIIEALQVGCLPVYGRSVWLHMFLQSDELRLAVDGDGDYAGYLLHQLLSKNPNKLLKQCVSRVRAIEKMFHPDYQYRELTS